MGSSPPINSTLSFIQGKLQYLLFNRPEWWAYAIFWRISQENETSLLSFGDGYFRGNSEIDLKKPTKPYNTSFDTCNDTCIDTGKDGEEVEWFYVVSLARSFGTDNLSASPVRVYLSQVHLWLVQSQALNGASGCERSREGYMHGIRTIVWIPVPGGVLELGSCDFIPENRVLVPQAISILANNKVTRIGTGGGSSIGISSSLDSEHSDSEDPELPVERRRVTKRGRKSGTGQDPVINHVEAERHRREKLNNRFYALRSVVPNVSRMDKASLLSDAIEYIKELRSRVDMLEAEVKSVKTKVQMEVASSTSSINTVSSPVGMEVEMRLFGAEALIRVQSKVGGGAHAPTRLMGALSELEMQVHHASIITVNDVVVQDVVARLPCGVMLQEEELRAALVAKLLL